MRTLGAALTLGSALALAACNSTRFGGPEPVARTSPLYNAPGPVVEPGMAMPSGPVSSQPLPPPPGASGPVASADYPPLGSGGSGPVVSDVPAMPSNPTPVETLGAPQQQVGAVAAPGRASVVGAWNAREASGSCKVQLSSSPALDLYKASAGACANRDLARVTGWDFRDGEVYLYQPGGAVAARLRPSGGAMSGVLAKSGAPLTLER
jgi:hypothetical protein